MGKPDWSTYQTAYGELVKRGVSHDGAADKALYLAKRGALPERRNWALIAKHCRLNEARSAHSRCCVSLFEMVKGNGVGQGVVLMEVLGASAVGSDPERITIAREALRQVPANILRLFTDCRGPLTSTEYARIHRFRKQSRNGDIGGVL